MIFRQANQIMLASAAILLYSLAVHGQTPATPVTKTASPVTVQIIPVSMTNEQVAATINGEKIYVGDVKKILDQSPYPVALKEDQKKQLRLAALEVLIEDILMRQSLNKQAPPVSPAEYNAKLQEFTEALKKTDKTIDQFVNESGQTKEQLQRDIIAQCQWRSLLNRQYPEEKLKPYYDANKPYFDKIYVKASHILIKLSPKATKEERDLAMQKMQVWRQEIVTGKSSFEDIARKYSDCTASKGKGGDVGQFPYKFVVVPEFASAAYALPEGGVSDVVQTPIGLHLIKLTERSKGEPSNFEKLREVIREVMAQDDDLYKRLLTEQRRVSAIDITAQWK
jgi:parvulin-like peptidyl-prolyl isomerase